MDVMNDHFLACNWRLYSLVPLEEFIESFYRSLERMYAELPFQLQCVVPEMIEEDWLSSYGNREGIMNALSRIDLLLDYRLVNIDPEKRGRLIESMVDFDQKYTVLDCNFNRFFPDLIREAAKW
jgi:acyl carrier protein phosphodiesterase